MRILDIDDNEISPSDVDGEIGYLEIEKILIEHFDAREEQPEKSHYKVKDFRFDDGSIYRPYSEADPRVKVINAEDGIFEYSPLEDEEERHLIGIDIDRVIDIPYTPAREEWDKVEYIQRYKLYTPAELELKAAEELKEYEQRKFLERGPRLMEDLITRIEKLERQVNK